MCDRCPSLEQALRDAYEANEIAERQIQEAERELRVYRGRVTKLINEREREHGESAEAKVVMRLIEFWAMTTGHTGAKVSPVGARADAVRKAFRMGHTEEELREAIEGAGRFPYVVNRQRSRTGTEKQRYDDLTTVFRDEVQIQRMRRLSGLHPDASDEPEVALSTQEALRRANYPLARVMAALWTIDAPIDSPNPDEWRTDCPVHFGEGLIARRSEDGLMSVWCARGCEFWRLIAALHLEPADLFENAEQDPSRKAADVEHAVPAHLTEAAGLLQARLSGLAKSG